MQGSVFNICRDQAAKDDSSADGATTHVSQQMMAVPGLLKFLPRYFPDALVKNVDFVMLCRTKDPDAIVFASTPPTWIQGIDDQKLDLGDSVKLVGEPFTPGYFTFMCEQVMSGAKMKSPLLLNLTSARQQLVLQTTQINDPLLSKKGHPVVAFGVLIFTPVHQDFFEHNFETPGVDNGPELQSMPSGAAEPTS